MNTVVIEGEKITSIEQLHDVLFKQLNLPHYYGRNLDALWDCVTGYISLPTVVIWNNFQSTRNSLGEYADRVLEVFKSAESEIPGFYIKVN